MCQTKHRSEFINPNTLNPMWSHGYFCWSHFVAIHVGCLPNRFTVIRMPSSTTSRGQPFHLSNPGAEVLFELICWSLKFLIQEDAADVQVLNAHSNQFFWDDSSSVSHHFRFLRQVFLMLHLFGPFIPKHLMSPPLATLPYFIIFCGVFQDWQQGIMWGIRVWTRSRFASDPSEGTETLCSGTLCLPYASGGRRQRWGETTGFNWDSGWEHGWAWCEVPWGTLVVALRFGCFLKGSVNDVNGKGRIWLEIYWKEPIVLVVIWRNFQPPFQTRSILFFGNFFVNL